MTTDWRKQATRLGAVAIAATIFTIDCIADFDVSISLLYIAALVVVATRGGDTEVVRTAAVCGALSVTSWLVVHGSAPDIASILRLAFALIAIGVTAALLVSRKHLSSARHALERSRSDLQNFTDSVPQILWKTSAKRSIDFFNRRYEELLGQSVEEAIRLQNWTERYHPDDFPRFTAAMDEARENGSDLHVVVRIRNAAGDYRWMSIQGRPVAVPTPDGESLCWYGGTTDIHEEIVAREELQRTRAALEASRAEVDHFANSVPYILWRSTSDGRVTFFNRRWSEVTGLDRDEALVDSRYMDMVHPDDLPGLVESIATAVSANGVSDAQVRVRQADGTFRWMRLYDRPVTSPVTGKIERFGGAADIQLIVDARREVQELNETLEQRVAERTAELMRTEARYASLFDVSNMTFAEMDFSATETILDDLRASGVTDLPSYMAEHPDVLAHTLSLIRTTRVNEALARMMGYESVADLVANPPAQNAEDVAAVLLRQLDMYFTGTDHIDGRTVLVGKHGISIPVYFTVNRLAEGIHLSSHLDLTQQERIAEMQAAAQEELARANRIATVGAFSASIAHELNQPIASMVMDTQTGLRLLRREQADTAAAERILQRLSRTAQRVADIVQHTRDAIVGGQQEVRRIDLCQLAATTHDLLDRELRRSEVTLALRCGAPGIEVDGDPVQLQQVLVNLITNAAEAMRDTTGERRITISVDRREDLVETRIEDTGPGILQENIDLLFKPFFTTKPTGVGMGLQICKSTIESMGGMLTVSNLEQGGAAFTFSLPRSVGEGPATQT